MIDWRYVLLEQDTSSSCTVSWCSSLLFRTGGTEWRVEIAIALTRYLNSRCSSLLFRTGGTEWRVEIAIALTRYLNSRCSSLLYRTDQAKLSRLNDYQTSSSPVMSPWSSHPVRQVTRDLGPVCHSTCHLACLETVIAAFKTPATKPEGVGREEAGRNYLSSSASQGRFEESSAGSSKVKQFLMVNMVSEQFLMVNMVSEQFLMVNMVSEQFLMVSMVSEQFLMVREKDCMHATELRSPNSPREDDHL
ncbi:hypothetical protein RRG08_016476 [Elysia crispata]|uniref:Uncharacterized protein n=1 Tax=Elysia crispata TaxID=231223 RepID=A0AAE0Y9P6_9GAST|nr:hypothetical protein RRG08_016476 [Elysia crispata]